MAFVNGGDITSKLETDIELTPAAAMAIFTDGLALDAYVDFAGRDTGVALIKPGTKDGYVFDFPDDLPELQVTVNLDGTNPRLCFHEFPVFTQNLKNWVDFSKVTGPNQTPAITTPKYFSDWNPMQTYGFKKQITQAQMLQEKAAYCVGRVYCPPGTNPTINMRAATVNDPITYMATPRNPAIPTISLLPVKRLYWYCGETNFYAMYPWQTMMEYIQYYINRYLKVPYVVTDLIPYGSNWQLQFQNATTGRNYTKLAAYLSGCNFLVQPLGKQDFWDKFYLAVPILIATVASIESGGAYAPELFAAIGALIAADEKTKINTVNNITNIETQKGVTGNDNETQIKLDSLTGGTLSDTNFYMIIAVIIILLLALYYYN